RGAGRRGRAGSFSRGVVSCWAAPVSHRAEAELTDCLEGQLEENRGRAVVAIIRGVPAIEANVEDEALILIGGIRRERHHLVGREIPPAGDAEPIVPPARRRAQRDLVARYEEARGDRWRRRLLVEFVRVEGRVD